MMSEQLDFTTLTWVKDEIQESLNQTSQALEAFIEDPTDTTQIRFCATYLHQIYGTLQMVEIYGAALLAEEMEKLANALLNDQIAQKDDAFDVLIRATLQMPSYLESLERGQPDMPVVLTPLLNDLRAARGEPLLSENAFFSPDLTVAPPEKRLTPGKNYPAAPAYARKLRPIYQVSLLGVLRDNDRAGSLKKMSAVLRELQNSSDTDDVQQMWWVAGGIIESLIDEGLENSTSVKMLMGQIDRQIKRIIDGGEQSICDNPPSDLIKNCLYYAGTSTSSGPRVSALKQAFNLEQLLPYGGALEEAMDNLKGSTADIMGSVSSVIKEELLQVKDQLDIFVRSAERDITNLSPLAETLDRTADTLAMLGLGDLRKVIQDQAIHLAQLVDTGEDPVESALMETASALLYVESSLDNIQTSQRAHTEDEAPNLSVQNDEDSRVLLPASEQVQIANLVIKESRQVLADVKEGFNTFAVEPGHFEVINDAPAKLAQIQGALAVMNLDRAAKLLGAANAYIREDVLAAQTTPKPGQLDTLADAITSIEYYLEAIEEGRGRADAVLAVAEISVEQLGHPVESVSSVINVEAAVPEFQSDAVNAPPTEFIAAPDFAEAAETDEIPSAQSPEQSTAAASEAATTTSSTATEPEVFPEEVIDEEILEIFVEEADEVLVTMTDCLHAWRANNEDQKSLETLRRSYHTIKGSGRLAGAVVMGDFAWSMENLLNRILDNKIPSSPAVFTLLNNAETVVKGILTHLKKESNTRPPIRVLAGQADAMAAGTQFNISDIASPELIVVDAPQAEVTAFSGEEDVTPQDDALLVDVTEDEFETISPEFSTEDLSDDEDSLLVEDPLPVEDSLLAEGSLLVEDSLPVEDSLFVEDSSASEELTPSDDIQIVDETVENFEPVSLEFEEAGQVDSESALSDESAVSVESTDLSDEFTPSDDALLVDGAIDELDTISLELSSDDSEESISESVEVERSSDYEPVLVEVFRKEATNHISAIREFLLNASGEPTEVDDELHRAFHTLLGSARMAGVLSISTLSEPSDKLIRTMHEANLSVDSKGQVLLHDIADAIETLAADFDRVDFSEPDHSDILNRIAELHDAVLLISKKVEIVQESIDSISDLPSSEESDNEEAEDAELISIFVEEADEILQGSDAMMQQWQQGGDDLHAIAELQRALHTLKGGARLAGFAPIGDLTHELEALLEAVAEGRRSTDEQLPPLVQQGLDWLGAAIQQIKTGAGAAVTPAEDLLLQIEHLASSSSAPDSIEPESVEPVSNETIAEDIDDAQPEIDLSELVEPYVEPSVESGLEPESFDTTADADKESDELLLDEDTIPASLTTPAAPEEIVEEGFEELTQELIEEPHFTSNIEPEAVAAATDVDYDPDLLEVFLEEAEEIQESTEQALQDWSSQLDNLDHVAELQRLLHTLKGGARMANVLAVGDLAHEMESLLERIADRRTTPTAEHTDLIQTCHDWLIGALEEARKLQPTSVPSELIAGLNAAIKGEQYSAEGSEPSFQAEETAPEDDTTASEITTESRETPEPTPVSVAEQTVEMEDFTEEFDLESTVIDITTRKTETAATDEQVRVRAELLNNLVNFSGEINIFNSRISQQLGASRFNLAELDQTVLRLREQLRNFEIETETQIMYRHETTTTDSEDFDPLELDRFSTMQQLSRSMVESLGDLTSIQTLLDNLSSETDVLLLQQQRVTSELQEGLMRTRMVSFSSILPRLRRIMRQTCKEVGKEAELQVEGGEGELDRTQLNRIVPALEHIMRNAIGHGLELPKERTKLGKPASGNVEILFSHQGSEVVLTISDDGTGINIDALRAKAIEKGRMQADADLTDNEIIEFILESGFSTATEVTQISGRGVGMDVVNSEVKQLGGTLHIDSQPGKGTTFTLRLPLTVLVNQALMVQVADASYAIQLPNIEHVVRVSNKELAPMISSEQTDFEYAGNHYQYLNLGTILHGTPPILPTDKQRVPLMLIHSADHRIALHVDNLFGRQEIVIKSVGPQLSTVGVLSGATILPNGEVALILDIANLVRSALAQMHGKAVPLLPSIAESAAEKALIPTVMIVDDSITVRKVTERLLKRYEYNIITAKDGVDALTVMLEQVPDIMLLDVEMPRMDGYELATTMRNDARLKQVPIIMITSRTGDKHRKRAMDIGVDMYMGKPYQEHDLISNIRTLTGVEQG